MFNLTFLVDHKNVFWICFTSSIILFRSKVRKGKYTIFEKVEDVKAVILPTNERSLICQTLGTLVIFFIATWKFMFMLSCSFLILIEYSIIYLDFMSQSATLTFFRTLMPEISNFSKLGYSPFTFECSLRLLKTSLAEFSL